MFSYLLKASMLALIIGTGTCDATDACFKNAHTCPSIHSNLSRLGSVGFAAAQWLNQNCAAESAKTNNLASGCFKDMTCNKLISVIVDKIHSSGGDENHQKSGHDFILQNCENK